MNAPIDAALAGILELSRRYWIAHGRIDGTPPEQEQHPMIRKSKGELIAICSECEAEFPGGVQDDFRAFVEELKATGWKVRKVEDEWEHVCPGCLGES